MACSITCRSRSMVVRKQNDVRKRVSRWLRWLMMMWKLYKGRTDGRTYHGDLGVALEDDLVAHVERAHDLEDGDLEGEVEGRDDRHGACVRVFMYGPVMDWFVGWI